MSKINLDFSSKINIECRAQDTFNLNLEVKNLDESNYSFGSDEVIVFVVLNSLREPVMVCANTKNINNYNALNPGVDIESLPNYISLPTDSLDGTNDGILDNENSSLKNFRTLGYSYAQAISSAFKIAKKLITGVLKKGTFVNTPEDYFIIKNNRIPTYHYVESKLSHNVLTPCITSSNGNININVQSYFFNIPEGKYTYSLKVMSDIENAAKPFLVNEYNLSTNTSSNLQSAYFSKGKTWMHGSLTIKKE